MSDLSSIERDVEASRTRLADTIGRIQDRLTVTGIVDEVMGATGIPRLASGSDAVMGLLRRHPVPVMIAAAGLGFVIYRMNRKAALADEPPLIEVAVRNDGQARLYDPDRSTRHPGADTVGIRSFDPQV